MRVAATHLATVALLIVAGCATQRSGPPVKRGVETPGESARGRDPLSELIPRIDAITGQPIVVLLPPEVLDSIDPADARSQAARTPPTILLDDGTRLRARGYDLFIRPAPTSNVEPADPDAARLARWFGPRWSWSVRSWDQTDDAPAEEGAAQAGLLVIEPPLATASASLWLGERRVPLQWLPSPSGLAAAHPGFRLSPTLPAEAFGSEVARLLLREESSNPLTRWRARLAIDGLALDANPPVGQPTARRAEFSAPPLELLASQHDQRWQAALARLHAHDASAAARLAARLARFVLVEPGLPVPAWESDLSTLEQLLDDLLNPRLSPQRGAELADAFLSSQASGVAWVTDDAGLLVARGDPRTQGTGAAATNDAPRQAWASVAVANLSDRATTCSVLSATDDTTPEPRAIEPGRVVLWTAPLLPSHESGDLTPAGSPSPALALASGSRLAELDVTVGGWSTRLAVLDGVLRATPPGLATGPFQPDLAMVEWLAEASSDRQEPAWATAALIQRVRSPREGVLPDRAWEIFVEARTPTDLAGLDPSTDAIFLYAGPPGAPISAWRIARDGAITNLLPDAAAIEDELGATQRAASTPLADRWTVRIPLPIHSIEADGLMRIGMFRIDPRGVRSSWPRALTPWQREPSRAAIQTRDW
jgi:hypothetical protein